MTERTPVPRQRVMWNGTCQYLGFAEQLRATQLAECEVLSVTPTGYASRRAEGLSARDMLRMADDHGVRLSHLDPIATWAPAWLPDNMPDSIVPMLGTPVDDFLRIAAELECSSLSAICTFPAGTVERDALVESFAALCDRAEGLRVDLEFIPTWGLPDLAGAWDIVRKADRKNGGILLDFWHFFRSGSTLELLRSIPASRIHSIQLCDAPAARRSGRTDLEDLHEDREPLGWGEFPCVDLLNVLAGMDALEVAGPEYFSRSMRGLSADDVAGVVETTCWQPIATAMTLAESKAG